MSTANRIAIVAVGFVAAILAFVALQPEDDATPTATSTAAAATATSTAPTPATAPAAPVATAPAATAPPEPETTTIKVVGGAPSGGTQEIRVTKGDRVRFRVTSDVPEEVHLHGYDVEKPVGPGRSATFDFAADLEGIFEIELHGTGAQIGELRVQPG